MDARRKHAITTLAKWLIAAAILALLFAQLDVQATRSIIQQVNFPMVLLCMMTFVSINYIVDSMGLTYLIKRFTPLASFAKVLQIRGKSYLLSVAHQNLGLGGIGYFSCQAFQIPASAAGALVFILFLMDGLVMSIIGLIALPWVQIGTAKSAIYLVYVAVALFYSSILFTSKSQHLQRIHWLRPFLNKMAPLAPLTLIKLAFLRSLYFGTIFCVIFYGIKIFSGSIPFWQILALAPIAIIIGFLPVTPFGLGTFPAAMSYFFAHLCEQEILATFSLTYLILATLLRFPLGLIFWFTKLNRNQ